MVSNKSLALFIILTVIVSLGGTLLSLNKLQDLVDLQKKWVPIKQYTGLAVAGKVELEILSNASCNVDSNVTFGSSGSPSGTTVISTESTNAGTNFSDCTSASYGCRGLQINNTGNVQLYINYTADKNASTFLGADYVDTYFMTVSKNGTVTGTEPGCIGGPGTTWTVVNQSNWQLCANLTPDENNDMMTMEFNVTLETTTPTGAKTTTITVTCGQAG